MMLSGLVGFTAIDVSLCGATPSQSVETFSALDVPVEQIGFDGFLNCASPPPPSPLSRSATYPSQARCVVAWGSGLSSARSAYVAAATASAAMDSFVNPAIIGRFRMTPPIEAFYRCAVDGTAADVA